MVCALCSMYMASESGIIVITAYPAQDFRWRQRSHVTSSTGWTEQPAYDVIQRHRKTHSAGKRRLEWVTPSGPAPSPPTAREGRTSDVRGAAEAFAARCAQAVTPATPNWKQNGRHVIGCCRENRIALRPAKMRKSLAVSLWWMKRGNKYHGEIHY